MDNIWILLIASLIGLTINLYLLFRIIRKATKAHQIQAELTGIRKLLTEVAIRQGVTSSDIHRIKSEVESAISWAEYDKLIG